MVVTSKWMNLEKNAHMEKLECIIVHCVMGSVHFSLSTAAHIDDVFYFTAAIDGGVSCRGVDGHPLTINIRV